MFSLLQSVRAVGLHSDLRTTHTWNIPRIFNAIVFPCLLQPMPLTIRSVQSAFRGSFPPLGQEDAVIISRSSTLRGGRWKADGGTANPQGVTRSPEPREQGVQPIGEARIWTGEAIRNASRILHLICLARRDSSVCLVARENLHTAILHKTAKIDLYIPDKTIETYIR